jgi:O-glycosyl hydrolase
MVCE